MDRTTYIRELVSNYGAAAWNVLDDFGVGLDEWDMRQTLEFVCDDYDLDLRDVLETLREACDDAEDEDDDIIQYDFSMDQEAHNEDRYEGDDIYSMDQRYASRRQARG